MRLSNVWQCKKETRIETCLTVNHKNVYMYTLQRDSVTIYDKMIAIKRNWIK